MLHDRVGERFYHLALLTMLLALGVVVLGAYVRLSDAGLGCPDWPGCYGHISVPQGERQMQSAQMAYPDKPLDAAKAWKEMAHRYFAGTLGLLIATLCVLAWLRRGHGQTSPLLPSALLGVVIFQAVLGMWTVTWLLKPVVVTAHLLGGMTTLALLTWLAWRRFGGRFHLTEGQRQLRPWALLGLLALILQISLGGWTSTNYAALACADLPRCQGQWIPEMDFTNAFHLLRELGMTADGGYLSMQALTAIHWSHRLGALITVVVLVLLALKLLGADRMSRWGWALLGLLTLQVGLGLSNVWFSLPLGVAVLHNAGAAMLLMTLVVLNLRLRPQVTRLPVQHAARGLPSPACGRGWPEGSGEGRLLNANKEI